MPVCPECKGRKGGEAFINRGSDISMHSCEWVMCSLCKGSGDVSEELMRRRAAGQEWESERRKGGESVIETAERLGVSPSAITAVKRGRADPPGPPRPTQE